jgi:hypothetical protein
MRHSITQPDVSRDRQQEAVAALPAAMAGWIWSRTRMLKEVWNVVQVVGAWPGVSMAPDRNGLCLSLRGVLLGHLRWDGRIDLPFGPEAADRLVAEEMASRDPDQPDTGRVVFDVRSAADVDRAVWLLRLAYLSVESNVDVCGVPLS